jgi:hypothetical protein
VVVWGANIYFSQNKKLLELYKNCIEVVNVLYFKFD